MTHLARTLVTIAARTLPADRSEWGHAMQAEFEAAAESGRPTSFALGCMVGSVRAHLDRPEGRSAFARSTLALATLVPLAAFHLGCSIASFRFALGHPDHFHSALAAGDVAQQRIAEAYAASALPVGLLLLALATAHLAAAWNIMDWSPRPLLRAVIAGLAVAIALTATIVSVLGAPTGAAIQFAGSVVELALIATFALQANRVRSSRSDRSHWEERT